jgi:hypothetical protein
MICHCIVRVCGQGDFSRRVDVVRKVFLEKIVRVYVWDGEGLKSLSWGANRAVFSTPDNVGYNPLTLSSVSCVFLQSMQRVVTGRAFNLSVEISSPQSSQIP